LISIMLNIDSMDKDLLRAAGYSLLFFFLLSNFYGVRGMLNTLILVYFSMYLVLKKRVLQYCSNQQECKV
ncbi:hypothetical protein, partial [Endozoicomonas sp. ONNA2]|uniref:hypothetical protein n=1 Tax=Endozoicomonas sp. ONNA2 TaxID=2828741 RepID=UPI002147F063